MKICHIGKQIESFFFNILQMCNGIRTSFLYHLNCRLLIQFPARHSAQIPEVPRIVCSPSIA